MSTRALRSIDERWMRIALDQARKGLGLTRPNPPVGAVVVAGRQFAGAGFHRRAGGPHAEIHALRRAGTRARGATLYVTLEPCSTTGRTPPCTDAIIKAGIRRVVVATLDPNPRHAGRGIKILRRAGIAVAVGIAAGDARHLVAPFTAWIKQQRPMVTLKMAVTLDGRIADTRGRSRWLSGPTSRAFVQTLRRHADAIMVGGGTIRADDPSLLPRPAYGRRPLRVIVSATGSLAPRAKVLCDGCQSQTVIATTRRCSPALINRMLACGVTVKVLPTLHGHVDLRALMRYLGRLGILHVLCEGGGHLAGALFKARLVDQLYWVVAPAVLGDAAIASVAGVDWSLKAAQRFRPVATHRCGDDCIIHLVSSQ